MAKRITVEDAADNLGHVAKVDVKETVPTGHVAKVDLQEAVSAVGSLEFEGKKLDIKLRSAMGWTLIGLLGWANIWAFGLVTFTGLGWLVLSDKVLMTVVGATVADLVGVVIIMAQYLFPQRTGR